MQREMKNVAVAALLFAGAAIGAQSTIEPLSGLPLPPGFERTADPVQSYKYCGKNASTVLYVGRQMSDLDQEKAWYTRAMPGAAAFTSITGVKTFIKSDGTAAVEAAGGFISFFRFSPGLTPAEMKILGSEPASRACTAD